MRKYDVRDPESLVLYPLSDAILMIGRYATLIIFMDYQLSSSCDGTVIVWDIKSKDVRPDEVIKVIEPGYKRKHHPNVQISQEPTFGSSSSQRLCAHGYKWRFARSTTCLCVLPERFDCQGVAVHRSGMLCVGAFWLNICRCQCEGLGRTFSLLLEPLMNMCCAKFGTIIEVTARWQMLLGFCEVF